MDNPPADLQAVFRVMNEWQSMHTEADLYTVQNTVPLLDLGLSLPHDVNAYPFSRYASKFIRDHRLGITEDPVRFPFLPKFTAQGSKDSVELFRLILSYMFDREPSEERHLMLANYIVQRALSSELLRDEIYVQLVNQTLGQNPRGPHSTQLLWTLMASCLSAFPPSTQLANHLLKYVSDAGTDGFDAVCQHKLLQCIGMAPELARSYPPCLLEWKTNRTKSAMALHGSFFDGEKGISQVESWTTAEEFAVNMFRSRRINDRISGWSVQLRDDVDTYECSGYDYVLDLIGEMELPPYFPCSTAYFLTMTDISRPASTIGRQHWPGEPHNTERLRVMPLEVEELADQPIASLPPPVQPPKVKTPPPPPRAETPPPPPSSPPPKRPSVTEDQPPIRMNPEDVYLLTEQAMSQKSALNKRKERIPEELSKKSVLNTRYASSASPPPPDPEPVRSLPMDPRPKQQQQPPPPRPVEDRPTPHPPPPQVQRVKQPPKQPEPPKPQRKSEDEDDMGAWVDNIFKQALSGQAQAQVQDLGSGQAVARDMKGGGDTLPVQFGLGAVGGGGAYGFAPFGMQSTGMIQPPAAFAQPAMAMMSSAPHGVMPTFNAHALQGGHPLTAFPAVIDPTVQLMQEQQFLQQQQQQQVQQIQQQQMQQQQLIQHLRLQQQQQLQMHQHAADLQAQLQMKELEKQVLASSLQAEMLRQQLDQMQGKQQQGRTQTQTQAEAASPSSNPPSSDTPSSNAPTSNAPTSNAPSKDGPSSNGPSSDAPSKPSPAKEDVAPPTKPPRPRSGNYGYTAPPHPPPQNSYRDPRPHSPPPPPTHRNAARVQGEVDESRPGGVNTLKRSYLSKSASSRDQRPSAIPPPSPAPMANHAKQAAAVAAAKAKAKAKAKKEKEVKFADVKNDDDDDDDDDEEEESTVPTPPSPPIMKKEIKKTKQTPGKTTPKPAVPVVKAGTAAGALLVAKTQVPRPPVKSETVNEEQEPRKAPGRIGIKWPPGPGKAEDRQNIPVSRLVITEVREESQLVRSKQSADEVQDKMRKRIQSSQEAAGREAAALRNQPPAATPAKTQIQKEDSGTQYQNWSNVDMATKRKELDRMLKGVNYGQQRDAAHPLPPLPPPPLPPASPPHEVDQPPLDHGLGRLDGIRTSLRGQSTGPFYTYKNRDWTLEIKKEVFSPLEKLNNPILVDLVFAQVVVDILSGESIRVNSNDKRKMKKLLDGHGVTLKNVNSDHKMQVKKAVINAAKELPIFFCRLFPVNGGSQLGALQMVGVSHSGVRLLVRSKDFFDDTIVIIETLKFQDIVDVHVPKTSTLLMRMKGRNLVFYTKYATQLRDTLTTYRREDSELILQPQLGGNLNDDEFLH